MTKFHRHLLLSLLITLLLPLGCAFGQSVVINGVPLVTSRTPVTFAGTMLLPMRDVFEALNSQIKWFASEQKIMATRGDTVIELWIGRPEATVNAKPVKLPVAPTLIGGSTYVPLRFPAEAFGGSVKWDNATRTALIEIPQVGETTTPTTPPTSPQAATVEGTVIQIVPNPAGVVLQTADNTGLLALQVSKDTVITRNPAGAEAAVATLADVRVGDYAQAVLAQGNMAARVALTYGLATGKIIAIAGNTLVLDDGTAFRLSDQVRVCDAAGRPIPLTSVAQNTPAQIIFDPRSKMIWEVRTTAAGAVQPPTTGQPQILTVGLLNNTCYFNRGDILQLQLTGTPGGQATISLGSAGRLAQNLPLQEVQPGVYQAQVTVPDMADVRNQTITGNLSVAGVRAQSIVSQTRLTIDNTPPIITGMLPAAGQVVSNTTPTIQLTFQPDNGAPLDPRSLRMLVNGVDVSRDVQGDEEGVGYVPEALRAGPVTVDVSIRDLAGNESRVTWTFTIGATGNNVIAAVWHNARGTLCTGNTLAVNARVFAPGGVATFSIADLCQDFPMQQVGNTNTYRGVYVVRPGDRITNALVRVDYRDPQGRRATMDATARLSIDTGLPTALAIATPVDQSQVGDVIAVSGQAPPNAAVRVTITYTTRLITQITGQVWQGVVAVNNHGLWAAPEVGSNLGLLGKADSYAVLAELLDANGRTISQQQIRLRK